MKRTSYSRHTTLNELNLTPLLDLAFVLLVIFIITTPQWINHLEMALPSAQPPLPPPATPQPVPLRITVLTEGQVLLNGNQLTLGTLGAQLRRSKSQTSDLAVVVQGTDEVDYQSMIGVLDLLRQLDITKVGLATINNP